MMTTLREQIATNVLTVTKFRELLRRMHDNRPNDDLELVRKAYEFSQKMALESAKSAEDEAKHLSAEQDVYFDIHKKQRHTNGSAPS